MNARNRLVGTSWAAVPALASAALLLALSSAASASPYETTRHTLRGGDVAIYNLVGSLEVVRGEGSSVVGEVTLGGKDAARLQVVEGVIGGRSTLRILYPGDRIVVPEFGNHTTSTLRVNEDGTFPQEKRGGRKVTISGRGPGIEARADVRLFVPAGKKVAVKWAYGKATVTGVDADLSLDGASLPVSATNVRGALLVDVGSGTVRVEGAEAEVSIDTGSGEVSLADIRGRGLLVDTGSGEVSGNGIRVESLSIDTGSGEIQLAGVKAGRASLETGSGGVDLELLGDIESLSIDSGSGSVSMTVPRTLGAELSVETGSGGIEADLAIEARVRKRNELVGRIGNGRGRIEIETGSGQVNIREGRL